MSTKKKHFFFFFLNLRLFSSSRSHLNASEVQLRVVLSMVDLGQWLIIKGVHLKLLGSVLGPTSSWLISFGRRVRLVAV